MKITFIKIILFIFIICLNYVALANDTFVEKVHDSGANASRMLRKSYRGTKDKTCKLENGKMKCVMNKMKYDFHNVNRIKGNKNVDIKKNKV